MNLVHLVLGVFCFTLFTVIVCLFRIEVSYLLLHNICFIVLFSFCLFMAFKLYVSILLARYLIVASLCSWGCKSHLE